MSVSATSSCPSGSTPETAHRVPGWHVEELEMLDVRCWRRLELTLPNGLVLVTGRNGAGKTSLVEAVSLGLVGVSPRTTKEAEIVRAGAEALFVKLLAHTPDRSSERELGYAQGLGRRMRVDGQAARSVKAFRAHGSVLVFMPDELRAVKGPPSARRRHIDRAIEGAITGYAETLSGYSAATAQRNALLRRIRAGDGGEAELDVWDGQVAALGASVVAARRRTLAALSAPFARYLERLGGGAGGELTHEPSPAVVEDTEDADLEATLRERMLTTRTRDIAAAQTLSGPHRDDVGIFAGGGVDLRRLGSQGEQRTAALALVLAQRDHLAAVSARPILLLDDALSELDGERRLRVLEALHGAGQTLVTSADADATALAAQRAEAHLVVDDGRLVDG